MASRSATARRAASGLVAGLFLACGVAEAPLRDERPRPPVESTIEVPPSPSPALAPGARRGLWVLCEGSQRVLENRAGLEPLLEDAQALGVTDLFVQVYRGGRAWFPSTLAAPEPYARVWREGSRDAFAILIERAHAEGLRVHAWVNVLSLASNTEAPIVRDLGPDAVIVDQRGRSLLEYPGFEVPPPDRTHYRMGTPALWLDPATPGVSERLTDTFAELLDAYPDLDGLHLDYIRYPDALPFSPGLRFGVGLSFGFGTPARARFREETGLAAPFGSEVRNGDRFDDWRRAKLTELVERVAGRARALREDIELSAAVIADRERAYLVDFQHWAGWLDAGLLDFAVPMLYTRDADLVRHGAQALAGLARTRHLWVGLGAWLFATDPQGAVDQLRHVVAEPSLGSALFSWDSIRDAPALREALGTEVSGGEPFAPR